MLNKDFYPTPKSVVDLMISGVDYQNKILLDPSAGKGDILDVVDTGREKYSFEVESALKGILKSKGYIAIGDDFLQATKEDISHIDLIIMNPPFSADDKHILHAWNIAPSGCEIVALCNYETINNAYSRDRRVLSSVIDDNGSVENIGDVFSKAERTTSVNIGLIRLFKPISDDSFDYSMFFMEEEEDAQGSGIMSYNEARAIVNNYVMSVKKFGEVESAIKYINSIGSQSGMKKLHCSFGFGDDFVSKEDYSRRLQRESWHKLFSRFNLNKYFTRKVSEKLDKFISQQQKVPFTMKNIYVMMDIIWQTREQNIIEALVEVVDSFTKHTKENRYNVEGWVTNKGHMINKRIIIESAVTNSWGDNYSTNTYRYSQLDDFLKCICNITAQDYDSVEKPDEWVKGRDTGKWYSVNDNFDIRFYKKGTMHIRFTNENTWMSINREYSKSKGFVLPSNI